MLQVSPFRLYILRACYLLVAVGVGTTIWPLLLGSPESVEHFRGVTWCLLGSVALLALVGIRHPLTMLPLLLFELTWKVTWVLTIGIPLRGLGPLEGAFAETWFANVMGLVIFPLAIPWGHVWRRYVLEPGATWSWRGGSTGAPGGR